jgi:hypothetical protein
MPRPTNRALLAALLAAGLAAGACGDGSSSRTPPPSYPDPTSLIPTAPAPQPTPTPTPGSVPEAAPLPAIPGGTGDQGSTASAGGGEPVPPPVSRMNVKVHSRQTDRVVLDSTPLVGPDVAYCRQIGYDDGRAYCPVRLEGHPERAACETARVGRASDTGRPGPTWSANGGRCSGPDAGASCMNHPDNQYLVFAYGSGTFRACTASGACGEITLSQ